MQSKNQTTIVIAHRLSTITNADRIACVANGTLEEVGTHDELMSKPNSRYRNLIELQSITGEIEKSSSIKSSKEEGNSICSSGHHVDVPTGRKEAMTNNYRRARILAKYDYGLFFIGAIGAIMIGLVFPGRWGVSLVILKILIY